MQMISDRELPVAVFHGLYDKVSLFDLAKVMNNGIKGSKLVQFNESGHALNIEEKEKNKRRANEIHDNIDQTLNSLSEKQQD